MGGCKLTISPLNKRLDGRFAISDFVRLEHASPDAVNIGGPQYNGAIENAQKDWDRLLDASDPAVIANLQLHAQLAACTLNQLPREVLGHQAPCSVFNGPTRTHFTNRQRKEAFDQISQSALELIKSKGHHPVRAWRTAVITWLLMNNLIRIESRNVSPSSSAKCAH